MGGQRAIVSTRSSRRRGTDISHRSTHDDWSTSSTARPFESQDETKDHRAMPAAVRLSAAAAGLSSRSEVARSRRNSPATLKQRNQTEFKAERNPLCKNDKMTQLRAYIAVLVYKQLCVLTKFDLNVTCISSV